MSKVSPVYTGSCDTHRYFGPIAKHKNINHKDAHLSRTLEDCLISHIKDPCYEALLLVCRTVINHAQSDSLKDRAYDIIDAYRKGNTM
jgi:hypothetical protein